MLQVDLRELARGPVQTRAELAGDDPLFEGLEVVLADPVRVAGRLQSAGEGRFYCPESLSTKVSGVCRRSLLPVGLPVAADIAPRFPKDRNAVEDPNSYPLARACTETAYG